MDKPLFNRVLVLDDDPASLYLARLTLEDINLAQEVATFHTAVGALEFITAYCFDERAAEENCPDLILLDVNMPGMDGFSFLEQLQFLCRQQLFHKVVVVLTSSDNPRDQDRMKSYGVRGFIVKPLTEEKVMHLVAEKAYF